MYILTWKKGRISFFSEGLIWYDDCWQNRGKTWLAIWRSEFFIFIKQHSYKTSKINLFLFPLAVNMFMPCGLQDHSLRQSSAWKKNLITRHFPQTRPVGSPGSATSDLKRIPPRNATSFGLSYLDTQTKTGSKDRQLQKVHQELEVGNGKRSPKILVLNALSLILLVLASLKENTDWEVKKLEVFIVLLLS